MSDDLEELVASLVRERSVLGAEEGVQAIVEDRLRRLGFEVERVRPDAEEALHDPLAGYPALSYAGRTCVAGRLRGTGGGPSLHLSGHVDVVPVDAEERWSHAPWAAEVVGGRMYGRGAGDMKAGLAAYLVAVEAALSASGRLRGDLVFTSVIEEENGGNGMRAVLAAGYTADATLIGEPSALRLNHGGIGVIWARLEARGAGGHAGYVRSTRGPVDAIVDAALALRQLERELNAEAADSGGPYNVNLGEIQGGVWPSSEPASVVLRARVGFGSDRQPGEAQELVRRVVAEAAPDVEVSFEGFRAHAYGHDLASPFVSLVRECHHAVLGAEPEAYRSTATTDARYVEGPALCYGPLAGNTHAIDEWVDLETVRQTAAVVALVVERWCG